MKDHKKEYIFGLDIGTRSIVGTVGYREGTDRFVVMAQVTKEHQTRAVIDGQIHDIPTVTQTIVEVKEQLEQECGRPLWEVSIAAAGRVLKTKNVFVEYEMPTETKVTEDHIHALDSLAVEKAYEEIRQETDHKDKHFYCVGYSPVKYYLNGYPMEMLVQHNASSIGVEMIATFLPDEVVDGLYSAVEEAGLHVASLTLEPIAAINVAIPERFRLLNIALVDVGAGTSDISIVKDGSVIAFGMMPVAGDEITEAIAKKYLVDFEGAEKIKTTATRRKTVSFKNILGESFKLTREEIQETAQEAIASIVGKISDKIMELNGGNSVSAVFVVGGGGKMPGFTEHMAKCLGLPENRVALRGAEVLQQIDFSATGIKKDSTLVTPIGICMEYYEQKSNFIYVRVNEERVKIYDNGKATVLDACIHAGYSQNSLFPSRGKGFTYTVNGEEREVKGRLGEPAEVRRNNQVTNLNVLVEAEDVIQVRAATEGEKGQLILGRVPECRKELKVTFLGRVVLCPKRVEVNKEWQPVDYEIKPGDSVVVYDYYTVRQLFEFMGVPEEKTVLVNGEEKDRSTEIRDGDVIEKVPEPEPEEYDIPDVVISREPAKKREPKKNILADITTTAPVPEPDPLLAPVKPLPAWAADLPIENPAVRANGYLQSMGMPTSSVMQPMQEQTAMPAAVQGAGRAVEVEVNGTKVSLLPKPTHMFVDVFDVYPFDLTKAGGKKMVCRVNGMDVIDFTTPIHAGDTIDLYWQK